MLTFILICVTCASDVTSLGWGAWVVTSLDVTGLAGGGDVNVHLNLRHVHIVRYVTGLGGGGNVNVHVSLRRTRI